MRRKALSLFLSVVVLLTCIGIPVFSDKIPNSFDAILSQGGQSDNSLITSEDITGETPEPAIEEDESAEETSEPLVVSTEIPTAMPEETTDVILLEDPESTETPEQTETPSEPTEEPGEPEESPAVSAEPEETPEVTEQPNETPEPSDSPVVPSGPTDITETLKTQNVTITEEGEYTVKDLTDCKYGIKVSAKNVKLNLENAEITTVTPSTYAPITIDPGATVDLNIIGESTITSGMPQYAGIAVCAESAAKANETYLKISGTGTLNVNGGIGAPAIGSNRAETGVTGINGYIEINGGIINAVGGINAPGIGNAFSTHNLPCGDIVINDGYTTITSGGGQSAVLGGAATGNPNGNLYINGGYIKTVNKSTQLIYDIGPGFGVPADMSGDVLVSGGSIDGTFSSKCAPYNSDGELLVKREFSVPGAAKGNKYIYNTRNVYTDADGKLYFYIPEETQSIAVEEVSSGTIYYSKNISADSVTVMDEYTGGPCICDNSNNAGISIDLDDITVNRLEEKSEDRLYVTFHEADGCTFPIHPTKTTYSVEMADGTPVDTDKVSLAGNLLTVDFSMVGSSIRVSAESVMNGYTFTDEKVYTINGDLSSNFDLAEGKLVINRDYTDPAYMKVTHGTKTYYVPTGDTINVYQSDNETPTRNAIEIRGEHTVKLSITDLNVRTYGDKISSIPLYVGDRVHLELELNGENNLTALGCSVMQGLQDTTEVIIKGDGVLNAVTTGEGSDYVCMGMVKTLTVESGTITATGYQENPGIGRCTLIVNGGTVTATGGTDSAGIGGDPNRAGGTVIVNDGRVYAYGKGNAAGIGGGSSRTYGGGGDVTINGGMVHAESEGAGMGIGYGGYTRSAGTLTINGGSVYSKNANGSPALSVRPRNASSANQYLVRVTLEDVFDQRYVEYSIGDDDTRIPSSTDENGILYLYLPIGYQWVRVYTQDGETYTYYKYKRAVNDDVNNNFNCVKNPQVSITKFDMPGKIEEAGVENPVIDNENRRVTVKVPYNIELTNINLNDDPDNGNIAYNGAYALPSRLNFVQDATTGTASATYTIYGEDKVPVDYTIILILANAPAENSPDVYDLSVGNVIINGHEYVEYGGVRYRYNPLGYTITTSTGDSNGHYVAVDMDMSFNSSPPLTFDNVTMKDTKAAPACIFYTDTDVCIKGECNMSAVDGSTAQGVMVVSNGYNVPEGTTVRFYGDGILSITGNSRVPSVCVGGGAVLDISKNEAEGYSAAPTIAFTGNENMDAVTKYGPTIGQMVTDGSAAMHLTLTDSPVIRPVNKNGDPLYQLSAEIDTSDHSIHSCTYDGSTYHLWDDSILYLMVPNGDYNLTDVVYGTKSYGTQENETPITVNSANVNTKLYTVRVDDVSYKGGLYPSTNSSIAFTVNGTLIKNNVSILLQPDNGGEVIRALITDSDGTVTISLPENPSPYNRITYTVYYQITGESPVRLTNAIILNKNITIRQITDIAFDNQIEDKAIFTVNPETGRNIFTLTLPYDEEFPAHKSYTPSNITTYPEGLEVINDAGSAYDMPTLFTLDIGGYMRAILTVVAQDKSSRTDYIVQLFRQSTPRITSFSFTQPTNPDGETINVTTAGTSINHIKNAVNDNNKKVFLYLDDDVDNKVEATLVEQPNGVDMYVAAVPVPKNNSDRYVAEHTLKALIGDVEQPATSTVYVPRQERALTGIDSFTIDNQLGDTVYDEDGEHISIVMPYDVDLTDLTPNVILRDVYATYLPNTSVDFTNDVTFTVTAENGVTKSDYIVHVENEPAPVATSIEFTSPEVSAAGRVRVKINGTNLDNTYHAINLSKNIRVSGTLLTGSTENSSITAANAVYDEEDGCYYATIIAPQNNDKLNDRTYELTVTIGDVAQTLTGNTTLTVPKKEADGKTLSDIIIADGQSSLAVSKLSEIGGNGKYDVNITVPYNTDLSDIQPEIHHNGENCTPDQSVHQNFDYDITGTPVVYKITAENGSYNEYSVYVRRSGSPKITTLAMNKPVSFKDTEINFDILGQFIPNLTSTSDVLALTVSRTEDNYQETGTIVYDNTVYGGHATCTLNLPVNNDIYDKTYTVSITINGVQQSLGSSNIITMPRRSTRSITGFVVNGQIGSSQITETENDTGNTVKFVVPYDTNLTKITPIVLIDGTRYTPTEEQDFDGDGKPSEQGILYTVYDEPYDTPRSYTVTAERNGLPSVYSVQVSNLPDTYIGGTIDVDVSGVFFYDMKVKAVPVDGVGDTIDGVVDKTNWQWHNASAKITLGKNESYTEDKEYRLEFYLDNFTDPITYSPVKTVAVPKRKTKAIKSFTVIGQTRESLITDTDVYVWVPYGTDISQLTTSAVVDGDDYTPKGGTQDFHNASQTLVYTVSAKDDDETRDYTVHVTRDGLPTLTYMSFIQPGNFQGGNIAIRLEGVFFYNAKIFASPVDGSGGEIDATNVNFSEGIVTATIPIPPNYSTTNEKVYRLRFVIDDQPTSYVGGTEIIVPRRTTRILSDFKLPDTVQEGDTVFEGNDIYIDVPYTVDLTQAVTPEILEYDADTITPSGAVRFDQPVQYVLSSSGDVDTVYTVHVTRIGHDPYMTNITVPDIQTKDTEYDPVENLFTLQLKAGTNLKEITPVLELDEDVVGYTPQAPVDFSSSKTEPVVYTVWNKYGVEKSYKVTITKKSSGGSGGGGGSSTVTITFNAGEHGTIASTKTKMNIDAGKKITASSLPTVEPDEGYTFTGWSTDGVTVIDPTAEAQKQSVTYIALYQSTTDVEPTVSPEPSVTPVQTDEPEPTAGPSPTKTPSSSGTNTAYISGYEEDGLLLFKPDKTITRAEVAKILSVLDSDYNPEIEYPNEFADVAEDVWYKNYINYAAYKGYISGYDEGICKPDNMITRAEFSSMLSRFAGIVPQEVEDQFIDLENYEWCRAQINTLAVMGVVSGYDGGRFMPENYITRSETVTMINKILGREIAEDILNDIPNPFADVDKDHWAYRNIIIASTNF